jgi:phage/plasmid-like protein (TIGR03299 family)
MAHNINHYIGRRPAWHQLGTVTGTYMSWQDIVSAGGLDYTVEKRQLEFAGRPVPAWGTFRSDNDEFLGAVGSDYKVIQHQRGFELVDALVSSQDGAHYETAGALGKGEKVWGLADLNIQTRVGNDESGVYLLFSTAHDGSISHNYRVTTTRVVCQNTLNLALQSSPAGFRVRHTKNADTRLDAAHAALAAIEDEARSMEEKLNFLAQRKMTRETMNGLMDKLFPPQKDADGVKRDTTRRANLIAGILDRYDWNDGNAFREQRGSMYNALNAVTEYTDHIQGTDAASRAETAMFGAGDRRKTAALDYLMVAATSAAPMPAPTTYAPAAAIQAQPVYTTYAPAQPLPDKAAPAPQMSLLDMILAEA